MNFLIPKCVCFLKNCAYYMTCPYTLYKGIVCAKTVQKYTCQSFLALAWDAWSFCRLSSRKLDFFSLSESFSKAYERKILIVLKSMLGWPNYVRKLDGSHCSFSLQAKKLLYFLSCFPLFCLCFFFALWKYALL